MMCIDVVEDALRVGKYWLMRFVQKAGLTELVPGQPELHKDTLSQEKKKSIKEIVAPGKNASFTFLSLW